MFHRQCHGIDENPEKGLITGQRHSHSYNISLMSLTPALRISPQVFVKIWDAGARRKLIYRKTWSKILCQASTSKIQYIHFLLLQFNLWRCERGEQWGGGVYSYYNLLNLIRNNFKWVQKPNSRTYNFVEVSGHNLKSFQTWGFRIYVQCLHYKPVSKHFCSKRGGGKMFL